MKTLDHIQLRGAHATRVPFLATRQKLPTHSRSDTFSSRSQTPVWERTCPQNFVSLLILGLLFVFLPFSAQAGNASVTANVSSSATTVDEPIRLTVTVTGANNANVPSHIPADGIDINLQGKSQRFELSSGTGATLSTIATYLVTPEKPGKFTIPAINLLVGSQSLTTNPIPITVEKGSGGNANSNDEGGQNPKIYAELLIPKDTAYVGEIIPLEVRFYFDNTVTAQLNPPGQVPQIDGEGFTKLRFPQPRLEHKSIKGRDYTVLAYQTSLVAAKSGDLAVGPASLNFVVSVPEKRRLRSPLDDPFGSDPFARLFSNQRIQREMTLNTDPKTLHIKQLPVPRPAGFSGAVGQFTLQSTAKPMQVKVGEPITFSSVVSGRGNFDIVAAPVLSSTDGWRTYPPTGKLVPTDEMGVSGDKTFEMAMIPEKKNTALPETSFVYFDPAQEKYITLKSAPIPVQIDGQAIVAVTPGPKSAEPSATPTPSANDLPPVKTALASSIGSFAPVWQNKIFWVVQGIPLILLGALVWPKIAAALAPNTTEVQRLKLLQEKNNLATALRSADPTVFFPAAARQLEIDALLTGNQSTGEEAEIVREISSRRDELAYGGGKGGRELSTEALRRYQSVLNSRTASK